MYCEVWTPFGYAGRRETCDKPLGHAGDHALLDDNGAETLVWDDKAFLRSAAASSTERSPDLTQEGSAMDPSRPPADAVPFDGKDAAHQKAMREHVEQIYQRAKEERASADAWAQLEAEYAGRVLLERIALKFGGDILSGPRLFEAIQEARTIVSAWREAFVRGKQ